METLEVIKICLLTIIAVEIAMKEIKAPNEGKGEARMSRREINGFFQNPMQDGYRKNKKGQYVPIKPNGNPYAIRPHLGDDEEDEV